MRYLSMIPRISLKLISYSGSSRLEKRIDQGALLSGYPLSY
jgi:hypothetical protein